MRQQPTTFQTYRDGWAGQSPRQYGQWHRQGDRLVVFSDDEPSFSDQDLFQEGPTNSPFRGQMGMPDPTANRVSNPYVVPLRWMAKVSIFKNGNYDGGGSGVLISDRHVLTAAHVVYDVLKNPAQFSLEVAIAKDEAKGFSPYVPAKKPDISPKYSPGTLEYDYAIITLSQPVADLRFPELGGSKLCFWGSSACGAGTSAMPVGPATLLRQTVFTAGFPRKHGGNQMWIYSAWLLSVPPQSPIMVFGGETTEGQSGSPVWTQQGGGYNLVGIVVARGNVNRVIRLTWDVVFQVNEWMLASGRRTPELGLGSQAWEWSLPAESGFEEHELPPKGLALLDHMHFPKTPAAPGRFTSGSLTKMKAADLNPLFINPSGSTVILDSSPTGLQHCLDVAITTGFGGLLGSAGQTGPGARDIIHVALVDLTGEKLTSPDLAAWGAPVDMYGASVPKILALYAAFQMRSDLRELVVRKSPSDGKQLESAAAGEWKAKGLSTQPDLVWLFDIRKWTPAKSVDFSAAAQAVFLKIDDNCSAGTLIAKVTLPYIGSVAWQSGLYHPTRSGLWLRASYCNTASWASPVKTPFIHNATALSAAMYFTLLAQGRLVDDASSLGIQNALSHACVTSLFPSLPVVASKCGVYDGYLHDCAWIQDSSVRYVIAVLSRLTTATQQGLYTQLCAQLDALIRLNNQSPKSPCSP
jgi:V8-like Glu-specific endopeptidase